MYSEVLHECSSVLVMPPHALAVRPGLSMTKVRDTTTWKLRIINQPVPPVFPEHIFRIHHETVISPACRPFQRVSQIDVIRFWT